MATDARKRKAASSLAAPDKGASVQESVPSPEEYRFDDDGTEDDYQDGDDEIFDGNSEVADTPNTPFSPRKKFLSQLKTIKCTFEGCTKTFNRPIRLTTHLRSHTNDRPFICAREGCEKAYFDQKHLNQHIKGSHTNERPYQCNWEGCTKSFLTATRLRRHIETHKGHNRFRCTAFPPCNETFRKHQTLQRHIRANHLELAPYLCTYIDLITSVPCSAGFDGAAGLRKHEDRVHGMPRFFCPDCTIPGINPDGSAIALGFTRETQLQNHIKKEHANCAFCDRKCSGQSDLQKHVESQHSGRTLEQRKNVPCTYERCKKMFTKKYNRDVHVRTQHEGSRFICGSFDCSKATDISLFDNEDGCGKAFFSKVNLEDHIRTAHMGLKSLANAKRNKSVPNSDIEDEGFEFDLDFDEKPQSKARKTRSRQAASSAINDLLGLSYTADSRRNIPCLIPTCVHLFIRDYDLQQHLRTKHCLSTPEIEGLEQEERNEPAFEFPIGDSRNDDAYGGEGGEEDIDFDAEMHALEGGPFWLGSYDKECIRADQWM